MNDTEGVYNFNTEGYDSNLVYQAICGEIGIELLYKGSKSAPNKCVGCDTLKNLTLCSKCTLGKICPDKACLDYTKKDVLISIKTY